MRSLTLGSLFSGIGGFEFAGMLNGITPLWASEIDKSCVSITKKHFPNMKHLGDITKVNGTKIEPVDIISFSSPCQDLSVGSGKRVGLIGERSSLFHEAIRIIKEMRSVTNGKYPRFTIWENVFGSFSSNGGEDFRIILQETASVCESGITIPQPSKRKGKLIWEPAGAIMGNNWTLAWRTLDSQYWGVPQRRSRVFLITDLGGNCAPKILFKPESLSRNFKESQKQSKSSTGRTESNLRMSVYDSRGNGDGKITNTLTGDHNNRITHNTAVLCMAPRPESMSVIKDVSPPLLGTDYKGANCVYCIQGNTIGRSDLAGANGKGVNKDVSFTLTGTDRHAVYSTLPTISNNLVRRLTPLECERLMGFLDGWTEFGHDGRKISDSARYKATGNSIVTLCVRLFMERIREVLENDK